MFYNRQKFKNTSINITTGELKLAVKKSLQNFFSFRRIRCNVASRRIEIENFFFLSEFSTLGDSNPIKKFVNTPRGRYAKREKLKISKPHVFGRLFGNHEYFFQIAIDHLYFKLQGSMRSHLKAESLKFIL